VFVNLPTLILAQRFDHGSARKAEAHAYMVFVAVLANELKEPLEARNTHYAISTKALQLVTRHFTLSDVNTHSPVQIVRRDATKG
jgi:hypothetical protein